MINKKKTLRWIRQSKRLNLQNLGEAAGLRGKQRTSAGVHHYDESYDWNALNLSMAAAIKDSARLQKRCVRMSWCNYSKR